MKRDLFFKVLSITSSIAIGIAGLMLEVKKSKRPIKLTEQDKNDIVNGIVNGIKTKSNSKPEELEY